jgi:L-aminopeptidase/D-esterase-like protein
VSGDLTDVPGVRVGHWTAPDGATGCTVVLLPHAGAVTSVDVRGAAPGTRETDLLRPENSVPGANAILLAGGSAFGLAAADGVVRRLEEHGSGFATAAGPVPIVPAAVLYDLTPGSTRPDAHAGYAAAVAAEAGLPCDSGRIGAGTGATVGKLFGAVGTAPGGLGTGSLALPGGGIVGAVVAVNPVGDVVAEDGSLLAGPGSVERLLRGELEPPPSGTSTTLAVVATDLPLTKVQAHRLAVVAHDGFAHAIRPVHTAYDGDAVFVVSTGTGEASPAQLLVLETAAVRVVAEAIRSAMRPLGRAPSPVQPPDSSP